MLKILKGTVRFLVSSLLWLVVGVGLSVLAVTSQVTDRETVKSWPDRAGTYENFVDTFPEFIAETSEGETDGESLQDILDQSGLDQDALFDELKKVVTPEFLQTQTNKAFDGFYDFFEAESKKVSFSLDFSEIADEVVEILKDQLITQIRAYPKCDQSQIAELVGEDFDAFRIDCLPPDVDVERDVVRFIDDFTIGEEGDAFLEDIVIDETFAIGDTSESGSKVSYPIKDLNDNAKEIQDYFTLAKNLPMVVAFSIVVLGFLTIMLSSSVMRGIRKLGMMLAGQGFTTAILYWLFPRLSDVAVGALEGDGGEDEVPQVIIDRLVEPLFSTIFNDIGAAGVRYGVLVGLVGVALWLTIYTWHKVHHHRQDAHAPHEHQYAPEKLPEPTKEEPEEKESDKKQST